MNEDQLLSAAEKEGISKKTALTYNRYVQKFFDYCALKKVSPGAVSSGFVQEWLDVIGKDLAPSTLKNHRSAVAFWFRCIKQEDRASSCKIKSTSAFSIAPEADILAIVNSPSPVTTSGIRDRALLSLMLHVGARATELLSLKRDAVSFDTRSISIPSRIVDIELTDECLLRLKEWDRVCREEDLYEISDLFFPEITPSAISWCISSACERTGLNVSALEIRNQYILNLFRAGIPKKMVAVVSGMREQSLDRFQEYIWTQEEDEASNGNESITG